MKLFTTVVPLPSAFLISVDAPVSHMHERMLCFCFVFCCCCCFLLSFFLSFFNELHNGAHVFDVNLSHCLTTRAKGRRDIDVIQRRGRTVGWVVEWISGPKGLCVCGVVWCGVVWCGVCVCVVWCGVVCVCVCVCVCMCVCVC